MSCPSDSSALRSVYRWLLLPFTLAAAASLITLRLSLALIGLSLRKRTPTASSQAPSPPHSGDDDHIPLTHYPSPDIWVDYLDDPYVQANCIHHLNRCLSLDPSQHSH